MTHTEIGSEAAIQPVNVQHVFSNSLLLAEVISGWPDRGVVEEDKSWWKTAGIGFHFPEKVRGEPEKEPITQFTDTTDSPAAVPA